MRLSDDDNRARGVLRGMVLILLGSVAAGCSADVYRFSDLELVTGATSNQREIIGASSQPYPGDVGQSAQAAPGPAHPVDLTGGSVSRSALAPVASAPTSSGAAVAALAPVTQPMIDPAPAPAPALASAGGTRPAAGGTQITLRPGETISALSRRFGVSTADILRANNLADGNHVQAGMTLIIPASPGASQQIARADAVSQPPRPAPASAPTPAREAVLPSTPKPREATSAEATTTGEPGSRTADGASTYKVAAGDTLHAIARRHGVTTEALKKANGLSSGMIRVGQVLTLPGAAPAPAQAVAAAQPAAQPATRTAAATASQDLPQYTPPARKSDGIVTEASAEVPDATGVGKMRWPARGRIISEFGKTVGGRRNDGVDISVPAGTPIRAAENGVVIYAGDSLKDFGNTVLLRHENGLVTVYGHADKLKVSRGDVVRRGDEIAISGMTGATEQPKLHFEVRDNSVPKDPLTYLQ